MTKLTTDRAVKKAFITDLEGGHIFEFQFAPHELNFEEGGRYVDRISTGSYFNDMVWISGRPSVANLRVFIDRTQESYIYTSVNEDPFSEIKRFPNQRLGNFGLDAVNFVTGIQSALRSSGFLGGFMNLTRETDGSNTVTPSSYSASPHYGQNSLGGEAGVIPDLEAILYYVRPKGLRMAEITIARDSGRTSFTDFEESRFTPPPKMRFYFGNIWKEGYITRVRHNLSVMNKQLVPQRLDADLEIAFTQWGYIEEIGGASVGAASDFIQDDRFDNPIV